MHDLGTLGNDSVGYGINASGQITGYTAGQPFLYDGTMHDLGSGNVGYGINASGQVTGGGGGQHTFLYDGTMHDLGTLGGFPGEGLGINASGQITGYSYTIGWEGQHAFLYSGGSMVDLNTLVGPASPWTLTAGQAINDLGQITGYGKIGGETHAFVLSPEGVAGLGSNQTADSGGGVGTVAGVEATFGNVTAVGTLTSTYLEANSLDQLQQFTGTNLAFDAGGILQAWDLSFSGTFSGSATITLHYDPTTLNGTPESELIVWHFVDHNHWEKVAGEVIDTNAHTVTFTTDSFSPFALGVPEPSSLTLAGLGAFGLIACPGDGGDAKAPTNRERGLISRRDREILCQVVPRHSPGLHERGLDEHGDVRRGGRRVHGQPADAGQRRDGLHDRADLPQPDLRQPLRLHHRDSREDQPALVRLAVRIPNPGRRNQRRARCGLQRHCRGSERLCRNVADDEHRGRPLPVAAETAAQVAASMTESSVATTETVDEDIVAAAADVVFDASVGEPADLALVF